MCVCIWQFMSRQATTRRIFKIHVRKRIQKTNKKKIISIISSGRLCLVWGSVVWSPAPAARQKCVFWCNTEWTNDMHRDSFSTTSHHAAPSVGVSYDFGLISSRSISLSEPLLNKHDWKRNFQHHGKKCLIYIAHIELILYKEKQEDRKY